MKLLLSRFVAFNPVSSDDQCKGLPSLLVRSLVPRT